MSEGKQGIDLSAIRSRVARVKGEPIWRSLEELSGSDEFHAAMDREFPGEWAESGFSRRNFMKLMGASMALAGVYGCSSRPSGKILPYVNPPEQIVPGKPLFFASALPLHGYAHGVLVETHEGRPTKIEGNPDHPASLGRTNVFMQASVLQLYDPERAANVTRAGTVVSWSNFIDELLRHLESKRQKQGDGVRLLTETVTSPTLAWQIGQFLQRFPKAKWHVYAPTGRYHAHQGGPQANGRPAQPVYTFYDRGKQGGEAIVAKTIVSLDSNFLMDEPGSLNYAMGFADTRRIRTKDQPKREMSRLWVFESTLSITGSMADHRYAVKPSQIRDVAAALASKLGAGQGGGGENLSDGLKKGIDALAAELQKNKGAGLIVAGDAQPPEVHALAFAMNQSLGNIGEGKPVRYIESPEFWPADEQGKPQFDGNESLRQLTSDMKNGRVDTLLILGGNPAYTAPADIPFLDELLNLASSQNRNVSAPGALGKTYYPFNAFTTYLGMYGAENNETAHLCQWALPEAHPLEAWGDARAFDGTATFIQPVIAPMHQGRSAIEFMDLLLTLPGEYYSYRTGYEILRGSWQQQRKDEKDFEGWWAKSLEKGLVEGSAFKAVEAAAGQNAPQPPASQPAGGGIELVFRPDPNIGDGSFANNGWLQELPKPFIKLTWDNAALLAPRTAEKLGVSDGSVIHIRRNNLELDAPAMMLPGLPEDVIELTFGYGRTEPVLPPRDEEDRRRQAHLGPRGMGGSAAMEPDGSPRGYNAFRIRTSDSPGWAAGAEVSKTDKFHELVVTRNHHAIESLTDYKTQSVRGKLEPRAVATPELDESRLEVANRRLVRTATLEYFREEPDFVAKLGGEEEKEKKPLLSLYPDRWDYSKGLQWGMSIDQQTCIGCNACVIACQAENNIAVVGRDEVAREREMHWIRIDSYFIGSVEDPKLIHQPVPCMQCETAPCELVCPVGATTHSVEGINEMTYNRCVGTRYCSNNCPYKVRRFNFFNWMKGSDESFNLQHNPDVTVRVRGVMEKCNYCIQRINNTRIEMEKTVLRIEEPIQRIQTELDAVETELSRAHDSSKTADLQQRQRDLSAQITETRTRIAPRVDQMQKQMLQTLQTACQQACPTDAIVFGNKNDPDSRVSRLKSEPLDYSLLAELTTFPRTTYMARLRNPNPDLEPGAKV